MMALFKKSILNSIFWHQGKNPLALMCENKMFTDKIKISHYYNKVHTSKMISPVTIVNDGIVSFCLQERALKMAAWTESVLA
jgi:hypothetical protein